MVDGLTQASPNMPSVKGNGNPTLPIHSSIPSDSQPNRDQAQSRFSILNPPQVESVLGMQSISNLLKADSRHSLQPRENMQLNSMLELNQLPSNFQFSKRSRAAASQISEYQREIQSPRHMGQRTAERWFDRHTRTYHKEKIEASDEPFYVIKKNKKKKKKQRRKTVAKKYQGSAMANLFGNGDEEVKMHSDLENPYSDALSVSDSDEEAMWCAICQLQIQNQERIVELKCQHIYHHECAKEWVLEKKKCPTCRKRQFESPNDGAKRQTGSRE